jgi:hypothetical protein
MDAELKFHPAAAIFPMLDEVELTQLAEDIKENGLIERISLYEGMILDGRNRYLACQQAGVEPRFDELPFVNDCPVTWVISKNLHRRHLTVSQRAMVAAETKGPIMEEARTRMGHPRQDKTGVAKRPPLVSLGKSRDIAGKLLGISGRSVERATKVLEASPELATEVKAGDKTLSEALREIAPPALGKRDKMLANAAQNKLGMFLAETNGGILGLESVNWDAWFSTHTKKDGKDVLRDLLDFSKRLRSFISQFKRRIQ